MRCVGCDSDPLVYVWTDRHGEAICARCGIPYEREMVDGLWSDGVPVFNDEFVAAFRRYWQETKRFTHLGTTLTGTPDDLMVFCAWMDAHGGMQAA